MTTRLSFVLLMTVLCVTTLASASDVISKSMALARLYETGDLLQRQGTNAPLPHPENFLKSSWTSEATGRLWGLHLALQLVKRPNLNARQVRIILDAISLSSSEFFTANNDTREKKAKADDAMEALRRRALAAFSKNQVADLFANSGKAEQDLLEMYYDISALPLKQRKASFRNASSNDKSDLWRTHLALFLVKRPDLNEWQKEIILAASSLATPEFFDVHPSSAAWKTNVRAPLRSLEEQILAAFSFEDGAKIFAILGDNREAVKRTPTDGSSFWLSSISYEQLSDFGPYKKRTGNQFVNQDKFRVAGDCQCSTESDWCPISGYCNGSTNCRPTDSGCGTVWRYRCDGACQ